MKMSDRAEYFCFCLYRKGVFAERGYVITVKVSAYSDNISPLLKERKKSKQIGNKEMNNVVLHCFQLGAR